MYTQWLMLCSPPSRLFAYFLPFLLLLVFFHLLGWFWCASCFACFHHKIPLIQRRNWTFFSPVFNSIDFYLNRNVNCWAARHFCEAATNPNHFNATNRLMQINFTTWEEREKTNRPPNLLERLLPIEFYSFFFCSLGSLRNGIHTFY